MPTYEYRCNRCGHTFEKFQQITAEPVKRCPECGRRSVERLIGTGAGIIFKGSGFYETDYRRSGGKPPKEAAPASGECPGGGAGAGGEGKPCEGCSKSDSCPAGESKKD
jgi:putative FmdB family regulatory protein